MNFKEVVTEIIYKNSKDTGEGVLIDFKNIHTLIDKIDEAFYLRSVGLRSEQLACRYCKGLEYILTCDDITIPCICTKTS